MGDNVRPQIPDLESKTKTAGLLRHVRFTRSQSTFDLQDADRILLHIKRYEPRDTTHEETELDDLHDLAECLRTTGPPDRPTPRGHSIRSFLKLRRAKSLAQPLQLRFSEQVAPATVKERHDNVAISTTDQRDPDGSRNPVFMPGRPSQLMVGHPQWPERTTSRGVLSATFLEPEPDSPLCGMENRGKELPASPSMTVFHEEPVGKLPDSLHYNFRSSHAEASFAARHFLRDGAQLPGPEHTSNSPSDPGLARDSDKPATSVETSLPTPTHDLTVMSLGMRTTDVTVEFPASSPLTGLYMKSDSSKVTMDSTVTPPATGPKSLLDRRRQPSLSDLVVKSTLMVPKGNLLPESPGFPNMLASMNFPTPPSSSRSPSLSGSTSSRASSPTSAPSMPMVRPRTSSKHAITRSGPAASLDEIVMKTTARNDIQSAQLPVSANDTIIARSESVASYVTACETPVHSASPSITSIAESHRQSTGSDMTTTTGSKRMSTPTTDTNRHSIRSNETTSSSVPTSLDDDIRREPTALDQPPQSANLAEPQVAEGKASLGEDKRMRDCSNRTESQNTSTSASAPDVTTKDVKHKVMSLSERRKARNGKSSDERERGIDMARLGLEAPGVTPAGLGPGSASIDSPVLGWFSHSGAHRSSSLRRRSPLVPIYSASIATTLSESGERPLAFTRNATGTATTPSDETDPRHEILKKAATASSHSTSNQWTISSIMATEIAPETSTYSPNPSLYDMLTMSPVIVVADLEPFEPRLAHCTSNSPVSIVISPDSSSSTPNPPPRSPFRATFNTTKSQSRHKPLPIKIPKATPTSVAERRTSVLHFRSGHSASISTPPLSPLVRQSHRLSLPLSPIPSNPSFTNCDRSSTPRQREPTPVKQPDVEPVHRRRSIVVRERFRKERIEKERELLELVAKTSDNHASRRKDKTTAVDDDDESKDYLKNQMRTTDEIEQRIQQLENHGDAWLSVLDPLLKNMTRTLAEMKKEGKRTPLLMGEFSIDMVAEARRSMYYSQNPDGAGTPKAAGTSKASYFDGFDGAYEGVRSMASQSVEGKKTPRGRSPSKLSHLRLQLDQPAKTQLTAPTQATAQEKSDVADIIVEGKLQDLQSPQARLPESPRTPQEHDFAAQVAISRRIQQQEVMMQDLMNRWGHIINSQDVLSTPRARWVSSKRNSKRSNSIHTVRASRRDSNDANTEQTGAPLSQYWVKNNENGGGGESRRTSRRWSSTGERTSFRYGDNAGMDFLMAELRSTSRLSFESMYDLESIVLDGEGEFRPRE